MLYQVDVKRKDNAIINVIVEAHCKEKAQSRALKSVSVFVSTEIYKEEAKYYDNHRRDTAWQISGSFDVLEVTELKDNDKDLEIKSGYKCYDVVLFSTTGLFRSQITMVQDYLTAYTKALKESNLKNNTEALIYELGQPLDKMDYLVHRVQYSWEYCNFEYSIDVLEYAKYTAIDMCSYDIHNCIDIREFYKGYHMTMVESLNKLISKGTYNEKFYRIVENMIAATQSSVDIATVIKEGCLSIEDTVGYPGVLGLPAIDDEDGINEDIEYPNKLSEYETAEFEWSMVIKAQV